MAGTPVLLSSFWWRGIFNWIQTSPPPPSIPLLSPPPLFLGGLPLARSSPSPTFFPTDRSAAIMAGNGLVGKGRGKSWDLSVRQTSPFLFLTKEERWESAAMRQLLFGLFPRGKSRGSDSFSRRRRQSNISLSVDLSAQNPKPKPP